MDAFVGLAPPSVRIRPAVFPKSKTKGPIVRCISLGSQKSFDVSNVDSVDKVYRVLTKHMNVKVHVTSHCIYIRTDWSISGNCVQTLKLFVCFLEC